MKKRVTYKTAGVDIDKANKLIDVIRRDVNKTRVRGSMDSIGGFGGLFDITKCGVKNPLLVSGTDGVGTKLKVAQIAGKHDTIGIDLVAMSVNDVLCLGAKPLFFLDYFASGKLEGKVWTAVLKSIIKGCRLSGCALLGGETAEMPGMYPPGEYDLAGFCVGIVDRKKVIDGKSIRPNDVILGIESSGFHSNGYSLVRKAFTTAQLKKHAKLFLAPTHLYVKPVLDVCSKVKVKGIANITGGGFYDNIPRVFPKNVGAVIYKGAWKMPKVFRMISEAADIEEKELYRTLNMGIGMIMVLSLPEALKAQVVLKEHKLKSWIIGRIVKGKKEVEIV